MLYTCFVWTGYEGLRHTDDEVVSSSDSVVILALNPRESGQIANKGFMMYSPVNVGSKMTQHLEQIATELFFMAKFKDSRKIVYKNISGGTFSKHPLKSTSHSTHEDFREHVLPGCKMILNLYLSNCLFI